jgi:hypothetical protein
LAEKFDSSAHVWKPPAETTIDELPRSAGTLDWSAPLAPQQRSAPAAVTAHVW